MVENCEVRGMTHMSSSPCFNQLSSSTCIGEEPQWHCSLRSSGHTQPALLFLIKHFYWALVLGLNVFIYYFISCSGFSGSLSTTSYWTKGHHDWFDFFSELTVPKPHSHCFPLVSAYFCCFDLSKVTCAAGEDMVYKLWRQAGFFFKKVTMFFLKERLRQKLCTLLHLRFVYIYVSSLPQMIWQLLLQGASSNITEDRHQKKR